MATELVIVLTFAVLLGLIALRTPIFISLGVAGVLGILLTRGVIGLTQVPLSVMSQLNNYVLVAAPLYILMGETIAQTGIGGDLYGALHKWFNRLPGGLAIASIFACAIFGAMCGVSIIGVAVIGVMALPEMLKRGYDKKLAVGSITAAGALAMLIPPSVPFILYGAISGVSVGKLFIGGIVPGVFLAVVMAGYVFFRVLKNPALSLIDEEKITWRERFSSLKRLWTALVLIIAVMVSIYTGFCTPTEAGAVGAAAAFLLAGFVYKSLNWQSFNKILNNTARIVAAIMLIVASAFVFGQFLLYTKVPDRLAEFSVSLGLSPILIIMFFMLVLVFMGCFIDAGSIILVTTPIFLPTIIALGYDPLWYGIILVMNMEMAVITPPVGLNLYTMKTLTDEVTMEEIILGSLPYVLLEFAVLALFVLVPELALWLPRLMQ